MRCLQQPWPGNIRKLEKVLALSFLFAEGVLVDKVSFDLMPQPTASSDTGTVHSEVAAPFTLKGAARTALIAQVWQRDCTPTRLSCLPLPIPVRGLLRRRKRRA